MPGRVALDLRTPVWVTPDGEEIVVPVEARSYTRATLSPDGTRIALAEANPENRDIWIYEIARRTLMRLTTDKKENRCCYAVSYTPEYWFDNMDMGYFGLAQNEGLEELSKTEALEQMKKLEEDGAVHTIWTMKTPFIGAICNRITSYNVCYTKLLRRHMQVFSIR